MSLCLALAAHVFDEAMTDFLSVYNPTVQAIRQKFQDPAASMQEFEYDLMGWSQSALNKVSRPSNFFFDMLTGRTLNSGVSKRALQWLAGSLLCATAIPVVHLSSFVGRGGTLVVEARPCRGTKRVTAIDTSLAEAS